MWTETDIVGIKRSYRAFFPHLWPYDQEVEERRMALINRGASKEDADRILKVEAHGNSVRNVR